MIGSMFADFRRLKQLCGQGCVLDDQHLCRTIEQAVVSAFEVGRTEIWLQTRGAPDAAFARQVAMYLAHVGGGLTYTDVGRLFARDRTTVAHACWRIEDLREDASFDRIVELLEGVTRRLAPGRA